MIIEKTMVPLARHYRVHAVNRAPGMAEGITMAEIATQHAEAIQERFGGPVNVMGMSSGGSLALQLAADHPEVVKKVVVAGAAYTLPQRTREAQLRYAEAVGAGRRGAQHQAELVGRTALTRTLFKGLMWLADPMMRPKDPTDMVRFARAEDSFDLSGRLGAMTTPTLVIGGERDLAYSPELFRDTADGIPGGRAITYAGTSHLGTFAHPRFAQDITRFLR